jgi:hypothetical protein
MPSCLTRAHDFPVLSFLLRSPQHTMKELLDTHWKDKTVSLRSATFPDDS